jgi:hypothetical protein
VAAPQVTEVDELLLGVFSWIRANVDAELAQERAGGK